jgi:hypothetical protein
LPACCPIRDRLADGRGRQQRDDQIPGRHPQARTATRRAAGWTRPMRRTRDEPKPHLTPPPTASAWLKVA